MKNSTDQYLVDANWLMDHLDNENIVVVDCQWDKNAYLRAHIPGAVMRPGHPYVKSETGGKLKKYLPTENEMKEFMSRMGIGPATTVICYDEWDNHFATRFWWVLKYYGHQDIRLLNGGWQAWLAHDLPVSFTPAQTKKYSPLNRFRNHQEMNVTMEGVLDKMDLEDWQVLDVRSKDEYTGIDLAGNKRGGHIPGAIHLEWRDLLMPSEQYNGVNYFMAKKKMQALLDEKGISKDHTIIVYCQSGVRGSFTIFCLEMLKYPHVKLYDGSMSEWANQEHTPLVSKA